jgi:hypothetical protein
MKWRINNTRKKDIVFYVLYGSSPTKYIIPNGTKEVYLTYDIIQKEPQGWYNNYNQRLCVKWEIVWE